MKSSSKHGVCPVHLYGLKCSS